jgi:hypothetical protein
MSTFVNLGASQIIVWFEQHTPKIVDVKKGGGGVITHKNVFVPRHVVLFLGLMYYFFIFLLV